MKYVLIFFFCIALASCKTSEIKMERIYALTDSNEAKFYLLNIIRENQKIGKFGDRPMVIINDTIAFHYCMPNFKGFIIKKSDIHKVKITEAKNAMKQYGAAAEFGLIEINTH